MNLPPVDKDFHGQFPQGDLLFSSLPLGVVFHNEVGEITAANSSAERILGLTFDQMRGVTSLDPRWHCIREDGSIFPGQEHPAMIALSTGESVNNAVMGVLDPTVDQTTWIKIYAIPIRDHEANVVCGAYAVFENITERRRLERDLLEQKDQLEMALHGSHLGTWELDIQSGQLKYFGDWRSILGYESDEITGKVLDWNAWFHHDDVEAVQTALNHHVDGNTPFYQAEYRARHKEGHWVWIHSSGRVMARDHGGNPTRVVGTSQDISARKRLSFEGIGLVQRIEAMIREAAAGDGKNSIGKAASEVNLLTDLTKRQRQILQLIAKGLTSAEIGKRLHIATATAISHRRNLMQKLDLHTAADVTRFAVRHKLIDE
jgi:PAS domain S-box-containing protein